MEVSNKVKSLVEYYGKLLIILTLVISVMSMINMSVGGEIITQFWQGFILASSSFIFNSYWKKQKERERIERVVEEIEELIKKYDTDEEIEKAISDKFDDELKNKNT